MKCAYVYVLYVYVCIVCMYMYVYVCVHAWEKCLSIKCAYVYVLCMYINVFYCMFAVSFGNLHDDVQAEPWIWLVIGVIPVFDKKKATRGKGPTEDGPWYPCV